MRGIDDRIAQREAVGLDERRARILADGKLTAVGGPLRVAIGKRADAFHRAIGPVKAHCRVEAGCFLQHLAHVIVTVGRIVAQVRRHQRKADHQLLGAFDDLHLLLGADARKAAEVRARLLLGRRTLIERVVHGERERGERCKQQQQNEPAASTQVSHAVTPKKIPDASAASDAMRM